MNAPAVCASPSSEFKLPAPGPSWPPSQESKWEFVRLYDVVSATGLPNFMKARVPVASSLNIPLWRSSLRYYTDKIICEFLEFGWPINYQSQEFPVVDHRNHKGAVSFPDAIDNYLSKEVSVYASAVGPFIDSPFPNGLVLSPLNSVPKRDSPDRRVILDLSWPVSKSVNDGIPVDSYLGEAMTVTYPTTDTLVQMILERGPGCFIFKRDLKRAFRQFPVDPGDYPFLGYRWRNLMFFDRVLPMGLRMSAMACQRVTNAFRYICQAANVEICNYLDDFFGAESTFEKAEESYSFVGSTLKSLGLVEAVEKSRPPSTCQTVLGVQFDTVSMTISVTPDRLSEISELLKSWSSRRTATKSDLQSLIGKLVFVSKCVKQSRIFLSRLLAQLRALKYNHHHFRLTSEFKKDISWWRKFLRVYNGVTFISSSPWVSVDQVFSTDACLTGGGGLCDTEYFHFKFPDHILGLDLDINCLELLTIVIACKLWGSKWAGLRMILHCDNMVSVSVLNTGKTRSAFLADCLREIWFVSSTFNFELLAVHIPGNDNRAADCLSRWHLDESDASNKFHKIVGQQAGALRRVDVAQSLFVFEEI